MPLGAHAADMGVVVKTHASPRFDQQRDGVDRHVLYAADGTEWYPLPVLMILARFFVDSLLYRKLSPRLCIIIQKQMDRTIDLLISALRTSKKAEKVPSSFQGLTNLIEPNPWTNSQ